MLYFIIKTTFRVSPLPCIPDYYFDEGLGVAPGQGLYTAVEDVAGQRARSFPVNTFLGSLYHALEVRER